MKINFPPDFIESVLNECRPQIMEAIKRELMEEAVMMARHTVEKIVREEVTEFCTRELAPQLKKALYESKSGIIQQVVEGAQLIAQELARAMAETAKENLEMGYKRRELFKALFE